MSGKNRKDKSPNVKGKDEKSSVKIAEKSLSQTKKSVITPAPVSSVEKKSAKNDDRADEKVSPTEKKLTQKKIQPEPAPKAEPKKKAEKEKIATKKLSDEKAPVKLPIQKAAPVKTAAKPVANKTVEKPVAVKAPEKPVANKTVEKPIAVKAPEKPVANKTVEKPVVVKAPEKPVAVKAPEKPVASKTVEKPVAVKAPVEKNSAKPVVSKVVAEKALKKAEPPKKKIAEPVEIEIEVKKKTVKTEILVESAPEKKQVKAKIKTIVEQFIEKKISIPAKKEVSAKTSKKSKKDDLDDDDDDDDFVIPPIKLEDEFVELPPYEEEPEPTTADKVLTEDIDDQEAYKVQEEEDLTDLDDDKKEDADKKKNSVKLAPISASKNDTMKVYMQDIGQISLVTKNEEVELAAKIHGGDSGAHDVARATLIQANLRLVVKIAHDFKGLGLPLLDLISEGNIGLMRAVEKFDPAKGAKFSSYAAWWIKQSMRRALANQSRTIRIPVQSAGKINKIKSVRMKLAEKLGREPTDAEIAANLDFSERTVAGLRLADLKTFSLHDPIQQGEDGEFQDIIPDRGAMTPDRILGDVESIGRLMDLLRDLDERERMILKMRFGLDNNRPRTLEEVSQEIGRTRERVRQIQNQALSKLKAMLADEADFTSD